MANFAAGDIVVHEKFGMGVVHAVSAIPTTDAAGNEDWVTTVDFPDRGQCRIASSFLKLECEVHRIDKLRGALSDYGKASVATDRLLSKFGYDFIAALNVYLHRQ